MSHFKVACGMLENNFPDLFVACAHIQGHTGKRQ